MVSDERVPYLILLSPQGKIYHLQFRVHPSEWSFEYIGRTRYSINRIKRSQLTMRRKSGNLSPSRGTFVSPVSCIRETGIKKMKENWKRRKAVWRGWYRDSREREKSFSKATFWRAILSYWTLFWFILVSISFFLKRKKLIENKNMTSYKINRFLEMNVTTL